MFHIDVNSRTPIYEQIERSIVKYISLGIMAPGQQLPSVRSMAQDLSINPNTVQKAYGSLESKGIVFTVVGKGVFIADNKTSISTIKMLNTEKLQQASENARDAGLTLDEQIAIIKKTYEG